nr:hypothetical protein [Mycobacterium montefiorense]
MSAVSASTTRRASAWGAPSASSVHAAKAANGIGRLVTVAAVPRTVHPASAAARTASRANRDLPTLALPANATPRGPSVVANSRPTSSIS